MKTFKTRHQLFLPEDMSRRLALLAKSSGRARSEILVEALDAWFTRRAAPRSDEVIGIRLSRIERNIDHLSRNQGMFWEALARLVRHQLITAASLPPPAPSSEAIAEKKFSAFINEVSARMTGHEPPPSADPMIEKLRRFP